MPLGMCLSDQDVCRWYDIGMIKKCGEVLFLSVDNNFETCQMGKVFPVCAVSLVQMEDPSIMLTKPANTVLHAHVTVYPTLVHEVKMRLPIKNQLPSNIQGKTAYYFCVFIAILNCTRLQTKAESGRTLP